MHNRIKCKYIGCFHVGFSIKGQCDAYTKTAKMGACENHLSIWFVQLEGQKVSFLKMIEEMLLKKKIDSDEGPIVEPVPDFVFVGGCSLDTWCLHLCPTFGACSCLVLRKSCGP